MKKIALLFVLIICTSFTAGYPCHPNGDVGPCTHRVHINDTGACNHFDYYGNRLHSYDYYPCGHIVHYGGDIYPCTHVCYY